ncbi:MAG: hypothetical protein GY721_01985 [Deltaproteobacteria bacterium]|nr:hypothetical protein [Deltaproteobacteria bacterium]
MMDKGCEAENLRYQEIPLLRRRRVNKTPVPLIKQVVELWPRVNLTEKKNGVRNQMVQLRCVWSLGAHMRLKKRKVSVKRLKERCMWSLGARIRLKNKMVTGKGVLLVRMKQMNKKRSKRKSGWNGIPSLNQKRLNVKMVIQEMSKCMKKSPKRRRKGSCCDT